MEQTGAAGTVPRAAAAGRAPPPLRPSPFYRSLPNPLCWVLSRYHCHPTAGRSKVAAFGGRPVLALLQAVKQHGQQFSRPPIGPVGQHLTLEDSR